MSEDEDDFLLYLNDDPEPETGTIAENVASSPRSSLRSSLIAMGFTPSNVDLAIKEKGDVDIEILLETIMKYCEDLPEPKIEPYVDDLLVNNVDAANCHNPEEDRPEPKIEPYIDDLVVNSHDALAANRHSPEAPDDNSTMAMDTTYVEECFFVKEEHDDDRDTRIASLLEMEFSIEEARFSLDKLGSEAPLAQLMDEIFAARMVEKYEKNGDRPITGKEKSNKILGKYFCPKKKKLLFSLPEDIETKRWAVSMDPREPLNKLAARPPYYFYGSVHNLADAAWWLLSRNLYEVKPEFHQTRIHPGFTRKEGYIHNLPTQGRFKISPIKQITKPPTKPEDFELALGYPLNHTSVSGINDPEKIRALKMAFQTDILSYYLSVLKNIVPNDRGINVLCVDSGIGGVEVALDKLGLHLNVVVSVEKREMMRKVLERWWEKSGQTGKLIQFKSIFSMSKKRIREMIERFGGFDLVVSQNIFENDNLDHEDRQPFVEYVNILERVREEME